MGTRGRAQSALAAAHKLDSAVRRRPASLNHPKMRAQRRCVMDIAAKQRDQPKGSKSIANPVLACASGKSIV